VWDADGILTEWQGWKGRYEKEIKYMKSANGIHD
jgi:hypothetical protein